MTARQRAIRDYPRPGTMDRFVGWMGRRSDVFPGMAARHFKARNEKGAK